MDYQTAVTTQFIPRCTAALNTIRDALIAAGLAAGNVTVSMPDTTDLRFQIVANRGNKHLTGYIELSDGTHTGGAPGTAIITLFLDANGTELTTSYTPGGLNPYLDDAGIDALLAKLTELEGFIPEVITKVRAWLGL